MKINLGASASSASKSLSCAGGSGSYTCLIYGMNSTAIPNGVVATATVTLSASATVSREVKVTGAMAATSAAATLSTTGVSGVITASGGSADTQAPTAPGSLTSAVVNGTQINLGWSASTDNVGVSGYRIERCLGSGCSAFAEVGSSSGTSYLDSGLAPGTTYRHRVRAVDAAGNLSAFSSTSSTTTGAASPTLSIFQPESVPSVLSESDSSAVELGLKFRSSVQGTVTGVRFYKGTQNTGSHTGSLWSSTGTLLGRVTFGNETTSGWQQANLSSPIAISANTTYVVSYFAPVGRYSATAGQFAQNGVDNGPLRALENGEDGPNSVYRYGASSFPTSTWNSTNYWVDVVFLPESAPAPPPPAAAVLSNLTCSPTSLDSNTSGNCTVTLSGAAPSGGAVVALSDNSTLLSVPSAVTVAAGSTAAGFTVQAGSIPSDQTAIVTAAYSGVSKTASISLRGAQVNTLISIWPASAVPAVASSTDTAAVELGLKFRSSAAGYVTGVRFYKGSQNTGTHTGSLWSNTGALLARVTFTNESATGWQQANFSSAVKINANTTYVVSYYAPKGRYAINTNQFSANGVTNSFLSALKNGVDGGNGVYRYGSTAFPNASWQASNYWVDLVFSQTAPSPGSGLSEGRRKRTMSSGMASSPDQNSASREAQYALQSSAPAQSLACSPRLVEAGGTFTCVVRLDDKRPAGLDSVAIASGGSDARVPVQVYASPGQREITFVGTIDKSASKSLVLISAGEGEGRVHDQIAVLPAAGPVLSLPATLFVKLGDAVGFTVAATDGSDLSVATTVEDLPAGAAFDQGSGQFEWTPLQEGEYTATFNAANPAGSKSTASTRIVVAAGQPQLTNTAGLSCVAGAIVTLEGRWLSLNGEEHFDKTGASLDLNRTIVRANGSPLPLLAVSGTKAQFRCPQTAVGQQVGVTLETPSGVSEAVQMAVVEAQPVLLTVDGSKTEGRITKAGSGRMAIVRDVRNAGEPAQGGDLIVVHATGLGNMAAQIAALKVTVGGIAVPIDAVLSASATAGVHEIHLRVPAGIAKNDGVPVQLTLQTPMGQSLASNVVTMAIE